MLAAFKTASFVEWQFFREAGERQNQSAFKTVSFVLLLEEPFSPLINSRRRGSVTHLPMCQ